MQLRIDKMQYTITSKCNRNCPYCTVGTPYNKNKHDCSYEYLYKYAPYFQGMKEIVITGGEPSIHFDFYNYVKTFKELYKPVKYTIFSNGYKFKGNEKAYELFNKVNITLYSEDTYKGCLPNKDLCDYIKTIIPREKLTVGRTIHEVFPLTTGNSNTCERLDVGPNLFEGKLYPCCAERGLDKNNYVEVTNTWREDILKLKTTCENCPWAK